MPAGVWKRLLMRLSPQPLRLKFLRRLCQLLLMRQMAQRLSRLQKLKPRYCFKEAGAHQISGMLSPF